MGREVELRDLSPSEPATAGRETTLNEILELQMETLWLAQQAMRELTAHHDLHPPDLLVLNLLDGRHPGIARPRQGGLSMSDLRRGMDIPPASATAVIDRMTALGLVERSPSEQDRRMVMVRLTETGRTTLQQVNRLWQQVQREAFAVLSDDQLTSHLGLMRSLQQGYLTRYPEAARPSLAERPGSCRSGAGPSGAGPEGAR